MSTTVEQIEKQWGQQVWLDNLSRSMLDDGHLRKRIDAGVLGLTSNPSIFHQAISKDAAYRDRLAEIKRLHSELNDRFEALVLPDIQEACDLFRSAYDQHQGRAGFVSFEVAPKYADDADQTVEAAKSLWRRIDRPNAMIKIPATAAGLKAIEAVIAEGINVNVTLIFSPNHIAAVQGAYLRGIRQRLDKGLPVDKIASVASVFVSRLDTLADKLLDDSRAHLRGKIAVSAAKMAYARWQSDFLPQMKALAPARPQKLLWASTGTKNPDYSDLLYVENLIGPETVNTAPEATLDALLDHGQVGGGLTQNLQDAQSVLAEFAEAGHDLNALGEQLQKEGLVLFASAYDALITLMA